MRTLLVFGLFAASITQLGCSTNDSGGQGAAGQSFSAGFPAGSGASGVGTGGTAPVGGAPQGGAAPQGGSGTVAGSGAVAGSSAVAGSGGGATLPTTLKEKLAVVAVEVSAGVKDGVMNYRIWGRGDLNVAPVYTAPLGNCETLVCFTTGSAAAPTARVVRLGVDDKLVAELVSEAGVECRGLAAGDAGQLAALLWNENAQTIAVKRYDAAGASLGSTALENSDNHPTDFEIGEARLEFGAGKYGAYYHVHSDSGHEGDTLKWVDAASGAESTEWAWGCSHSMSNLLRFHPISKKFLPACVTDCYPGTSGSDFETQSIGGIYLNHDEEKILDVDAGCDGNVAAELGSAAIAPGGYKVVFNAHQAPATKGQDSYDDGSMNQDLGFVALTNQKPGAVVWLTSTPGNEADASISRFEPTAAPEQYLIGWVEVGQNRVFKLALLDPAGAFVESAIDVTAQARWGRRDDPFREHVGGDVVWAWFDSPGSTTLHFARVDSGASAVCN